MDNTGEPDIRPSKYSLISLAVIVNSMIAAFVSFLNLVANGNSDYRILALVFFLSSLYSFIVGFALFKVKHGSWKNGLIVSFLNIFLGFILIPVGLAFASIPFFILYGVLVYYLQRPNVKAYIGVVKGY
jgi:hypothetical protein